MPPVGVNLPRACLNGISSHFLKLGNYFFNNIAFDIHGVKVLLEVRVGELVPRLKFSIVITFLLYSIIC